MRAVESAGIVKRSHHTSQPVLDIAIGVISLVVAAGIYTGRIHVGRRHRDHEEERRRQGRVTRFTNHALSEGSAMTAFLAGVVLNLPGVWYLDALADIARSQPSVISILLQLLLFNAIMFALIQIPIVVFLIRPQRASEVVSDVAGRARDHGRAIGVGVAAVVGVYLIAHGVLHLPGGRS